MAQDVLRQKPTGGAVFAFRGRRGDRVKLLYWDGQGFCLYYKVLERGRFPWPSAEDGALRLTSKFYDIERDINGQAAEARLAARRRLSRPRVEAFFDWSEQQLMRIPGKSDLAKAFRYGLSRRDAFSLFLTDGRVAIDNNPAERALRPIGIGRKNWLFAGADTGAETLARAMTIIETAKLNGLDPQAYLADVLDRIHDHKITKLDELLPWNWKTLPREANSQAA